MKHLYIETYGCQMNVADSEVVASVMKMAGYEPCESLDEADAVFLNTCSVRDNAEQKIIHRLEALNALRRKGRKLIIGVLGCMALTNGMVMLGLPSRMQDVVKGVVFITVAVGMTRLREKANAI